MNGSPTDSPVSAAHTNTFPSASPDAMSSPSGLYATAFFPNSWVYSTAPVSLPGSVCSIMSERCAAMCRTSRASGVGAVRYASRLSRIARSSC